MGFEPVQQIGAYRIFRLLGEGGTGAVYEVEHTQLGVLSDFGISRLFSERLRSDGKAVNTMVTRRVFGLSSRS